MFKELLRDGVDFSYRVQKHPNGLVEAFILGENFIGDDSVALILGDNIYYGLGLSQLIQEAAKKTDGAIVLAITSMIQNTSWELTSMTRYMLYQLKKNRFTQRVIMR